MERQRRGVRRLVLIALASVPLCLLALGMVVASHPRSFTSHEEAIGYVLEQHNVAYENIALTQTRLDMLNFYSYGRYSAPYGSGVTVQLPTGRRVNGRVECRIQMTSCYVYISELGLNGEALPELTDEQRWGPLDWIWEHLPKMPVLVHHDGAPTSVATP